MIDKLLENWLDNASERSYQAVFVQMLSARGYRVVHSTRHCALEYGKDILAISPKGVGCAYQLKGNPGGKLGLAQFREEIQPQLVQLISQPVEFPGFPNKPHQAFLVSNGFFEEEVQLAVEQLNRANYYSKIFLISRGDLLEWAKELGTTLWPSELSDTELLLELFLSARTDLLPVEKLAKLLSKLLRIDSVEKSRLGKTEFHRLVSSASLLTGIATYGFSEAKNYFAVISAWVILAVSIIGSKEKHNFSLDGPSLKCINLVFSTIGDVLLQLWQEIDSRDLLYEGNFLTDRLILRWRFTTLLSLMSSLILYDDEYKILDDNSRDKLLYWINNPKIPIALLGEGAVASIATWLIVLRKYNATNFVDKTIASVAGAIIEFQRNEKYCLASPYYSYQEIMKHRFNRNSYYEDSPINDDNFYNSSYTAESIFHLLVRTNMKSECKLLWDSYSQIMHKICLHDEPWEYCTLKIQRGIYETRVYPPTYDWSELKKEAIDHVGANLPCEFATKIWLLSLWWHVAPYRYTKHSSAFFIEQLLPTWHF